MSLTPTPVYAQTPMAWTAFINNATGLWTPGQTGVTNAVSLVSGGTNGAIVESINVTTNDITVTYDYVALFLNDGTNNYFLSLYEIPIGSGTSPTISPFPLLTGSQAPSLPYDANGNPYLYVPPNLTLYVANSGNIAITSGKFMGFTAVGSLF